MPILLPKKIVGKTIGSGERAFVQRIKGRGLPKRMVARFSLGNPVRKQKPVKEMFYENKIAQRIYPNNFIKVRTAAKTGFANYGDVLLSEEKYLDQKSRSLITKLSDVLNSDPRSGRVEAFIYSAEYLAHEIRVKKHT
jgi:hypothetical protein